MPQMFGMHDTIKTHLQELGFDVIDISYTLDSQKVYRHAGDRIINFIRKIFLKDKQYKSILAFKRYGTHIIEKLQAIEDKADYALLIRPDIYPETIIRIIQSKCNTLVGYQWDGLHRFPAIYPLRKYFARFFVFDPKDLKQQPQLLATTNFYFEYPRRTKLPVDNNEAFFIGLYSAERVTILSKLAYYLRAINYTTNFIVFIEKNEEISTLDNQPILTIHQFLTIDDVYTHSQHAGILVDLLDKPHTGLSFRVFEAIGNNKKLITNNALIKKYNFYTPNNIYVLDTENLSGIEAFLAIPYEPIDEKIKQMYSFSNWTKYMLNIHPHIPITLPP